MSSSTLSFGLVLSVLDKATAPLKTAARAFGDLGGAAEKLKKSAEALRVGRENVDNFTGRLKEGLASIVAPAREVEDALSRVAADAGPKLNASAGDLEKLKQAALSWSQSHVQSSTDYIKTAGLLMKAGLDEATAMKATEAALRTSTATGKEASEVASTLSILYGQMGDKTKDASTEFSRLGDVLTKAQQSFQGFDAGQLADPLKDALPAAKAAGISVEQLVATLGTLNAAGLKGGEAGAAFAQVLEKMKDASAQLGFSIVKTSSGGVDMVGTLKAIEAKFGSLDKMTPEMAAKLQAAFGPAAFKVLAATLGQTDKLAQSVRDVTDSTDAAAKAANTIEGTDGAQLKIAQQQLDAMKVALAAGLIPAVRELIPYVKDATTWITNFVKEHPGMVAFVGTVVTLAIAVGSVIGPLMSMGGAIASMGGLLLEAVGGIIAYITANGGLIASLGVATAEAWAFAAAMLANPITWIVLAIIALAVVLYVYWDPISKFFADIWANVKAGFIVAWDAIVGVWTRVKNYFTNAFAEIKAAFQVSFVGGIMKILTTISPLALIIRAFAVIGPWLAGLWVRINAAIYEALVALGKLIVDGIIAAAKWLFNAWMSINQAVFDGIAALWDGIKAAWSAIADFFGPGIRNDLAGVTGIFDGAWDSIKGSVSAGIDAVMAALAALNPLTAIQTAWNAVTEWFASFSLADAGANIVNTIVEGMKSAAGAPVEAMKGIVQDVRNLLPFSPAKEGPLKDLHRVKLVETVASAVNPAPLVDAMTGATGDAMNAVQAAAPSSPIVAPITMPTIAAAPPAGMTDALRPASSSGASSGGGVSIGNVTIQVPGTADKSVLENLAAWVNEPENARLLANAVQRHMSNEARKELG